MDRKKIFPDNNVFFLAFCLCYDHVVKISRKGGGGGGVILCLIICLNSYYDFHEGHTRPQVNHEESADQSRASAKGVYLRRANPT